MNMRSKIAVAFLVAAMAGTSAAPAFAGPISGFGDVDDNVFYTEAVSWLVSTGITSGVETGCYAPSDSVTRGQVSTFLYRLDTTLGNNPVPGPNPFDDVAEGEFYFDAVAWMAASGIATGVSPTEFLPGAAITRGDFATLLWRYAGEPGGSPAHQFTDVTRGYQQTPVSWMAAEGITTGISTSPGVPATEFVPDGLVDRAQAATFLFRFVAPASFDPPTSYVGCVRDVRSALVAGGLTLDEAACAAPHVLAFAVDYLTEVLEGRAKISTELLDALVAISSTGCLSDARINELLQRYF